MVGFYIQILAGTLGFAGHLVSPTVSEANVEGRPTIKDIKLKYIPTIEIIANILTKPLARPAFELLYLKLSIISFTDIKPRL